MIYISPEYIWQPTGMLRQFLSIFVRFFFHFYQKLLIVLSIVIIVLGGLISASRTARGLKFWLQVALGALIKPCRLGGNLDIRIREIRIFRKSGFLLFWCLWTPLDLGVDPWWSQMVSGHHRTLQRSPKLLRGLHLFRLKPLLYGCLIEIPLSRRLEIFSTSHRFSLTRRYLEPWAKISKL